MKSFFTSLLYAAVAGGLSSAIAGKAFEKHLRCLAALLFAAVTVTPIVSLLASAPIGGAELWQEQTVSVSGESLFLRQAAEDAAAAVKGYILNETGIRAEEVCIDIESVEGEAVFRKLRVKLADPADTERVCLCLEGLVGSEMEIEVTD